ncbi:SDR family oxidoreductase [Streptomyces sp. NPDC015661]|uniref:SDR family oxidoreductase n=1 Tax=Streptomyces sp. NPDC015661 TaxID=3364961 RepID=UPI0036FC1C04
MSPTAVITGASGGIGAATAEALVKAGYDVVVVARRADRLADLAARTGGRAHQLDVTDASAVADFAATLDRCDVLVNIAGGAFDASPVATGDPASWLTTYEVNVLGTLHMTQALLPLLGADGGGTIVNLTSTAASVNYESGGSYSAAKHAAHALSETLRLELAGQPVRVVEIAPGMVHTEEFALNRFHGDRAKADAVYAGVDGPLRAEDVAECVRWAVTLPAHVNIDRLVVRPLAQAAQHKVHRGPIFATTTEEKQP